MPTSSKNIAETIFEIESDLNLLSKKISDVYFWERIRVPMYKHLLRESKEDVKTKDRDDSSEDVISGFKLLLKNLFVKNPFFSSEVDLLFYTTGRRKRLEDNLWWDIYVDPIVDTLDRETVVLERPFNVSHSSPPKTPDLRYTDLIEYTGTALQKTGAVEVSISEEETYKIEKVKNRICSSFRVDISLQKIVKNDLSLRKARLPLYRRLVQRIDPEVVFLIASYNGRETFVEACQAEGVPVVELQHGVINRYHLAYSFPHENKNVFPDYFFSFGKFWSDSVALPVADENVYPIGYPNLEARSDEYAGVQEENSVLFISQARIGEHLSRFAKRLSERSDSDENIIYKLHPKEYDSWSEKYPWLANSNVTVVTDDPPLYRLFSESKRQVGVYSTALCEGLYFGLDTCVIDLPGVEQMEYLIENGYITLVDSVDDYIIKKEKGELTNCFDKTYFFRDNSINNFNQALDKVIS